ncbi:MAG TPA: LptA/OstA family protein [Pararhizobium sp.]|nr:LptA/OstA family protein [Pararhizobium sp.]
MTIPSHHPSPVAARRLAAVLSAALLFVAAPPAMGLAAAQQPQNTATKPASGNAPQSLSALGLSSDQPIQIESDKLQIDDKTKIATFTGNVKVVQGDMLLKSGKMVVHYTGTGGGLANGSSQIQKILVSNKVYLKSGDQEATADQGTYDMASQLLTLTGDQVVLTKGKNVFVGCKLTVHVDTSEAELDSCGKRVMIQLVPQSQQIGSKQSTQKK